MKINAAGNLLWSKCFGGSKNEELFDIEVINGTIFAVGFTNSIDGDIPPDQKNYDMWLLAIDAGGNKMLSKIYGGGQNEVGCLLSKKGKGFFFVAGFFFYINGDGNGGEGDQEYLVDLWGREGKTNRTRGRGGGGYEEM